MNEQLKQQIRARYAELQNKTKVAAEFGISARTVGRIVDTAVTSVQTVIEADLETVNESWDELPETPAPVEAINYFVIYDGKMINVTRVYLDGSQPPHSEIAYAGQPGFDRALDAYTNGDYEAAFLAISVKFRIEKMSLGKVVADPARGTLLYIDGPNEFKFSSSLCDRVIKKIETGEDVEGLMKFANLLAENPSRRAVSELFDFLVAQDIEITDEGMVRCFKKVRANYTDCHTGKFDNSVGVTVQMPRHMVNEDSEVTCSHGLHVCSKAYLSSFGGARVLAVDVNPADFVSIPHDYYSIDGSGQVKAKARVCRYIVVADITGEV